MCKSFLGENQLMEKSCENPVGGDILGIGSSWWRYFGDRIQLVETFWG